MNSDDAVGFLYCDVLESKKWAKGRVSSIPVAFTKFSSIDQMGNYIILQSIFWPDGFVYTQKLRASTHPVNGRIMPWLSLARS